MYINDEVLTHMDNEELADLVHDMMEVVDVSGGLVFAANEVANLLHRLYNESQQLGRAIEKLNDKYGRYIPVPGCPDPMTETEYCGEAEK